MIVQFRNEKVSNHGSIPITIDCNVVAFIVFEEGFHQPIKRTKQSVFLDVTVFRHTLVANTYYGMLRKIVKFQSHRAKFQSNRSLCAAEQFLIDASLEAVDQRAPNNSKNWKWSTEGDVSTRRSSPALHGGE
ncbi:hypothetical protein TNCV_3259311 [Trichonephila clavipes]|nr:hypothetical protein TNCV_3259311 [Trichonephila clavipes]